MVEREGRALTEIVSAFLFECRNNNWKEIEIWQEKLIK